MTETFIDSALDKIIKSVLSEESLDITYYDAIDILDKALFEIRGNNVSFSDNDKDALRSLHELTLAVSLHLLPPYQDINALKKRTVFNDLPYLIAKYKLPFLKDIEEDSEFLETSKHIYDAIISGEFRDNQNYSTYVKDLILNSKNVDGTSKDFLIDNIDNAVLSRADIVACYSFIEDIGETEEEYKHRFFKFLKAKQLRLKKLFDEAEINQKPRKPKKLVTPNNNPSKKVFGKSNQKTNIKENDTPYYSVPGTSDEILEYRSLISTTFAKDIKVKDTKTLTGQLALVTSISDQKERYKPMISAPLNSFDMYVYSNTIACLRDYISTKVDIDLLLTSFSGTDRIREETDFTRSFVNSLMKMRSTSVFFEYKTKNKTVSILEPILSFTLTKETNDKTGKEKRYITLHKMPEFFEWAESLNQVISIPDKLFRIEYKKNGKISKLRQTKRNTLLINHLLEHISNFRYFFENKNKKEEEEKESPERFSKILFETLYEIAEAKTKEERRDVSEIIEHCLEYWKECNLVDYRIETEAATGGRRYIAINLFYPKNPQLKLS